MTIVHEVCRCCTHLVQISTTPKHKISASLLCTSSEHLGLSLRENPREGNCPLLGKGIPLASILSKNHAWLPLSKGGVHIYLCVSTESGREL